MRIFDQNWNAKMASEVDGFLDQEVRAFEIPGCLRGRPSSAVVGAQRRRPYQIRAAMFQDVLGFHVQYVFTNCGVCFGVHVHQNDRPTLGLKFPGNGSRSAKQIQEHRHFQGQRKMCREADAERLAFTDGIWAGG